MATHGTVAATGAHHRGHRWRPWLLLSTVPSFALKERVGAVVAGVRRVAERPVLVAHDDPGRTVNQGCRSVSPSTSVAAAWPLADVSRLSPGTVAGYRRRYCDGDETVPMLLSTVPSFALKVKLSPVVVRLWRVAERPIRVEHERPGSDQPGVGQVAVTSDASTATD